MHYSNLYKRKEQVLLNAIGITAAGRINLCKIWTQKSFELIEFNTLPPMTSVIMHHYLHPNYMYSNASFFDRWKHIAKFLFKKSRVSTTCFLGNKQSLTLLVRNDMTNVALICAKNCMSREPLNIDEDRQKEHPETCFYD